MEVIMFLQHRAMRPRKESRNIHQNQEESEIEFEHILQ
jgi:hypothetical protein